MSKELDISHVEKRRQSATSFAHGDHVDKIGLLANQEEHEISKWAAVKKDPWTLAWCIYAIWVLVLNSFENQAGGAVLGIPQFRKDFGYAFGGDYVLPAKWQSAFSGGPVASAVFGALGSGYIADRIGRKLMFAIGFVFSFVGITLEVIATTNPVFFAGKFVNGFAIGTFISLSMTYVGEIAPLALRGMLTAACAIAFTVGPFIVALIVNSTGNEPTRWAYRATFVAQYGFSGLGAILLPFAPESPWWLMSKGKEEKAARALKRLGQSPAEIEKKLANIKVTLEEIRQETEGVTYLECFKKSNLRRTIIAIAPLSIQALSGVYFVSAYATYYFQLAGYSTSASFKLQIVQQSISMIGNIMAWYLVDRVGRRGLMFWGLAALTVMLFLTGGLAVAATPGAIKGTVALLLIYCWFYNVTIGAAGYTIMTETATSRLRVKTVAVALALQNGIYTMWAFVIPYIFNPNQANLGARTSFIFGGLAVFCLIYLWFYQPESAGRTYAELDEMFMKKVPARKFKGYKTETESKGEDAKAEFL